MSSTPIDQIKSAVKIQDVFADHFEIVGHGSVLTTREHDSLKIWPAQGRWRWYSDKWRDYGHCDHGDVLDAYQLLHRCDLPAAITALAQRAGIELKPLTPAQRQAADQQRAHARAQTQVLTLAANWFHAQLLASPAAQSHLRTKRGWDLPTLQSELVGYNPAPRQSAPSGHLTLDDDSTDKNVLSPQENLPDNSPLPYQGRARVGSLSSTLRDAGLLDHPAATAVLSIPPDMIIYVHRAYGIVTALSTRSVEGKFHYNLKLDLVGNKQLYHNSIRKPSPHLLVEGQADAIALAQLGIAATALCGSALTPELVANLGLTHVAPDTDSAGQKALPAMLLALDPLTRVVRWLPEAKDAADMVKSAPGELQACLDTALTSVETMAILVARATGDDRTQAINNFFDLYARLDDITATDYKPDLAKHMAIPLSQFNRLHKAWQAEHADPAEQPVGERFEHSAGLAKGGFVFEQCIVYNSEGAADLTYAVRTPTGEIKLQKTVDVAGVSYIPHPANLSLIEKKVIRFPERPVEYGTQKQLIADIAAHIHKYLDIPPFYEKLASYYVLFTWVYDLFDTLPYLRALGDYGTGKSRFLKTIGFCCYRPIHINGAASVSPIFRVIDMFGGTLIVDEADLSDSDAQNDIIKIFNTGFERYGVVLRSEKDPNSAHDDYIPVAKSVYGPKILASRRPFTDRATESRCLTRRTSTARPHPRIPHTLDATFEQEATALRNKLLMFRLRNHRPVTIDQSLADDSVEPRLNQVTMALKSIIDDDDMRNDINLFIQAYNAELINDRQMTLPAVIIQALANIFYAPPNLLGEEPDFSIKNIHAEALKLVADLDSEIKLSPKKVGSILSEDLGLTRRGKPDRTRRATVLFSEDDLLQHMRRFGLEKPQ